MSDNKDTKAAAAGSDAPKDAPKDAKKDPKSKESLLNEEELVSREQSNCLF